MRCQIDKQDLAAVVSRHLNPLRHISLQRVIQADDPALRQESEQSTGESFSYRSNLKKGGKRRLPGGPFEYLAISKGLWWTSLVDHPDLQHYNLTGLHPSGDSLIELGVEFRGGLRKRGDGTSREQAQSDENGC
jgi:hypothetical protein